jgi:L-malate glycosyltransferase
VTVSALPRELTPTEGGRQATAAGCKRRVVLLQTQAEGAGAQEVARILGEGLSRRGYDVHQIFFFRRTAAFDRHPNTFFCARERPAGPIALAKMLVTLVRHLRRLRPACVLCFQHYGNILGALAAHMAGVHAVVANRTSAKSLEPAWTRLVDLAFGWTGLFRAVVVNSKAIAEEYGAHPKGYRARLLRIDHGFQAKRSTLRPGTARDVLRLPQGVPLLGCVARLHPTKNLGAAVRLLADRPDWHLALAGQGPARTELEQLARSLGAADRVHFTGELDPEGVATFLKSLDVFVFPTLAESFGLAAVEAAQAGVPVVANELPVLREVLAVDGAPCALFVDVNDPTAFAGAVARVLGDVELRARLTACAAGLAHRYALDEMVDRYAALIERMTGQTTPEAAR